MYKIVKVTTSDAFVKFIENHCTPSQRCKQSFKNVLLELLMSSMTFKTRVFDNSVKRRTSVRLTNDEYTTIKNKYGSIDKAVKTHLNYVFIRSPYGVRAKQITVSDSQLESLRMLGSGDADVGLTLLIGE